MKSLDDKGLSSLSVNTLKLLSIIIINTEPTSQAILTTILYCNYVYVYVYDYAYAFAYVYVEAYVYVVGQKKLQSQ